jgi:hypothetical protein
MQTHGALGVHGVPYCERAPLPGQKKTPARAGFWFLVAGCRWRSAFTIFTAFTSLNRIHLRFE